MSKNFTIILLAAGLSRRMGASNKLLLPFRGTTLVEYNARKLLSLNAKEIIVVTGFEAPKVQFRLHDYPFRFIYNPNFEKGMTSSIQQGVYEIDSDSKGVLICPSDMPELTETDLQEITRGIACHLDQKEKLILAPSIDTRIGNPVFFSRYYFEVLLQHKEPNGCKSVIKRNLEHLIKVPLNNTRAFNDIDTIEDYQRY